MNSILVLTDFSDRAEQAAEFAWAIAREIQASLLLCNVVEVPEQLPLPSNSLWPGSDYNTLKEDSLAGLSELASRMKALGEKQDTSFKPIITYVSYIGLLPDVANELVIQKGISLIVMGSHHSNNLKRLLLGSDTYNVIDNVKCPVLLIPEHGSFNGLQNITYATDLAFNDLSVMASLVKLAAPFNAKIIISNISRAGVSKLNEEIALEQLKQEIKTHIRYGQIFYDKIVSNSVHEILLEMSTSKGINILTLMHRRNGFLSTFFQSSISKRIANSAKIPLLIFPASFTLHISDFFRSRADHA